MRSFLLSILIFVPFVALSQGPGIGNNTPSAIGTASVVSSPFADTNHIYVSLAGTVATRDVYTLKTPGYTVWTNNSGTFGLWHDPTGNTPVLLGYWEISNNIGTSIYEATIDANGNVLGQSPGGGWQSTGGVNPIPVVVYGTNFSYQQQAIAPFPLPVLVQTNVYYVMTNGDDSLGVKGRLDKPFATLTYVLTNASPGDVVYVFPGQYNATNWIGQSFQLVNNLSVIGAGRGATYLNGPNVNGGPLSIIHMGNSNYFANFTSTNLQFYGGITATTNSILQSIDVACNGDAVVADQGGWGISVINCRLSGTFDKIADLSGSLQGNASDAQTNYFFRIVNCQLYGGPGQDGDGMNVLSGRLRKELVNVRGIQDTIVNSTTNNSLALPGWLKRPVIVRTNFISGQFYTNLYGLMNIEVSATITNVEAAIAGTTVHELWVFAQGAATTTGTTNFCGNQTLVTSLVTTNCYFLSAWIPPTYVWVFTNRSAGAGNVSNPRNGQIYIP